MIMTFVKCFTFCIADEEERDNLNKHNYFFKYFKMENVDIEILNLLNNILSEEELDKQIYETQCLKSLIILLKLKRKRILSGEGQKILYPIHQIYEQETANLDLQCEVLKIIFLVIEELDEEILRIIMYLNFQLDEVDNFTNSNVAKKIALLLNEIILICKVQGKEYVFQENMSLSHIDRFLFHAVENCQNSLRIIVLSTVLPNYVRLLNEIHQLHFLNNYFLKCRDTHNLDVMCILFKQIDTNILLSNCDSILFSNDFWEYLENCISSDMYDRQKQAIFLLKKFIQAFYDYSTLHCKIPYLETTDVSTCLETPEKIWNNFCILLDASKEKQLHLIWPSLPLLSSLKYVNNIWQVCIYKKFLMHTQNAVVYFVASHILSNKIFFPKLSKCFLSAINKNEYMHCCTKMFSELPNYCNTLTTEEFLLFLEDVLEITWVPTAAWHLFSNTFCEILNKIVPFKFVEPVYKVLKRLPHVCIRKGCISIFFNYFIANYDWKNNFEDALKLLFILKDHDYDLFVTAVSNHIDTDLLNNILNKMKDGVLDMKTFEILVQIIKILKFEIGLKTVSENMMKFNKLQVLVYANFFEKFEISDIEKFVLEQITGIDEGCADMFLIIVKELSKFNDFREVMYSKVLHILSRPSSYDKTTLSVSLEIVLHLFKLNDIIKQIAKDLKHNCFECGKTDDSFRILILKLYFLVEEYPEIPFLDCILHNQSDLVISKMFECLPFSFLRNNVNTVHFLVEALNVLPDLSRSRHFKTIIFNYINYTFSISFLEILHDLKMSDAFTLIINRLLSLSETFPVIDYYLSEKIKEITFCPQFSRKCSYLLIPVVEELLLKGIVVKKDDR